MTVALINPEQAHIKLRPVLSPPQLNKWLEQLEHLQQETEFYHRLLHIGIPNCSDRIKTSMTKLMAEFAAYKTEILPALIISLNEAKKRSVSGDELSIAISKKLETHDENLKKLKSRVFPHLNDFQTITFL